MALKGVLPKNIDLFMELGKCHRYHKGINHGTKLYIDKAVLVDLYVNQLKSVKETSKSLGVCSTTVHNYLCEYNIPCRPQGFQKDNTIQVGESHHNWKGGISCEPYCGVWSDLKYKKSLLVRDKHTCQKCGVTQMLSLVVYGKSLVLHHIDYNKKNCHPNNLITLCSGCNTRANKDREQHTLKYQDIMYKKYSYTYGACR